MCFTFKCMSKGVSFLGCNGTETQVFSLDVGGWMTCVSPLKIPSEKTIIALIMVSLFVEMNTSTCGCKIFINKNTQLLIRYSRLFCCL